VAAQFVPGGSFENKDALTAAIRRLEQELDRKSRANPLNGSRGRIAYQCATHRENSNPSSCPGACPFYIRCCKNPDGGIAVMVVQLTHTCTREVNGAAIRREMTVSMDEAKTLAKGLVGEVRHGKLAQSLTGRIAGQGLVLSKSVAYRAISSVNHDHNQVLHDEQYGAMASYLVAFKKKGDDNFSTIEVDSAGRLVRCLAIPGAAVKAAARGVLSGIVTMDFSHVSGRVTERDAVAALLEDTDASSASGPSVPTVATAAAAAAAAADRCEPWSPGW
jgi:hypothetical protein